MGPLPGLQDHLVVAAILQAIRHCEARTAMLKTLTCRFCIVLTWGGAFLCKIDVGDPKRSFKRDFETRGPMVRHQIRSDTCETTATQDMMN